MVSVVSPRRDEHPDDLLIVESPSLRGRLSDPGFADNPLLPAKPSFGKRAARAFIRFLIACGIGVAGTLAWQSYGDAAKQTIATLGAEYGWSMAWLSPGESVNARPSGPRTQAVPAAQAAPAIAPDRGSSSDLEQLKTMTLGLAATLTTMRERIEQVAAGQEQTASDVAKLQAAEQDIRHKISAIAPRPAVAAPSKPPPPVPARPPAPAPAPPR